MPGTNSGRSSTHFEPEANDTLVLFGEEYAIQPHPSASDLPFSSEGRRATVCQLRNSSDDCFALKVFKKRFRSPALMQSVDRLSRVGTFEGMLAAKRRMLLPDGPEARKCNDLSYAMLMPWMVGETWFDILQKTQAGYYLRKSSAIHLCYRFLRVVAGLERALIAHTDISPGNVVLDFSHQSVQLLDLEEIYTPNAEPPAELIKGTLGYRHQTADDGKTLWCVEGDRYSAAIVAAELLILSNQNLAQLASEDGFFMDHCRSDIGKYRYKVAESWLSSVAPEFADLFKHSWACSTLARCPKVSTLCKAIGRVAEETSVEVRPAFVQRESIVVWEPLDIKRSTIRTPIEKVDQHKGLGPGRPANRRSSTVTLLLVSIVILILLTGIIGLVVVYFHLR
jgi:hypothetical protein